MFYDAKLSESFQKISIETKLCYLQIGTIFLDIRLNGQKSRACMTFCRNECFGDNWFEGVGIVFLRGFVCMRQYFKMKRAMECNFRALCQPLRKALFSQTPLKVCGIGNFVLLLLDFRSEPTAFWL